ncbi:MAG: LuxR family transcriptional regulator [Pseudomonadota bacterium]
MATTEVIETGNSSKSSVEAFAQLLAQQENFEGLRNACIMFFANEGVRRVSYHHLPPPGAPDFAPSIMVATHGFPEDWVEKYIREKLYLIDPITRLTMSAAHPIWWTDFNTTFKLSADETRYMRLLADAKIGDGIAIPLFGPHGRNGYAGMSPAGFERNWSSEQVHRLHLAAQAGHLRYCEILQDYAPQNVKLSRREQEILTWMARGKSNSVIAQILGLSQNTINTYSRRIFDKLAVTDRVNAALRGLAVGLIGWG